MSPVLATPPADPIVGLDVLKAHLRVDMDDDNALIETLADAAEAWLDGWTGVLGRAVRPQTWRETFDGPGPHLLSLPDVGEVTVTEGEAGIESQTCVTAGGVLVTAADAVGEIVVTYECGLPERRIAAAQAIVMMLVAQWYAHREAVAVNLQTQPLAVQSLVQSLRWQGM